MIGFFLMRRRRFLFPDELQHLQHTRAPLSCCQRPRFSLISIRFARISRLACAQSMPALARLTAASLPVNLIYMRARQRRLDARTSVEIGVSPGRPCHAARWCFRWHMMHARHAQYMGRWHAISIRMMRLPACPYARRDAAAISCR